MTRTFRQFAAAAFAALSGFGVAASARAESITSTAVMHYRTAAVDRELKSNTVVLTPTPHDTPSTARFLQPAAAGTGATLPVSGAQCRLASGPYQPIPSMDDVSAADTPAHAFHAGEDLLFSVEDGDRNADATVRDEIEVDILTAEGDRESLRLLETDVNTGVFAGRLPTRAGVAATAYDCVLSVSAGTRVSLEYGDKRDATDVSQTEALIDPFGVAFDSETGEVIDGVRVSLVDADTGQPAPVFGDDGVSAYPNSVVTGQTVQDAGGRVYPGVKGSYRFPLAPTGRYRLVVEAGEHWRTPSSADPQSLKKLTAPDGGALAIVAPSFGAAFDLVGPAPLRVDLPLDPLRNPLILEMTASTEQASVGDFVQYRLTLQNPNGRGALAGAVVTDTLPVGVRVQAASLKVNGTAAPAEVVGRTLRIPVGSLAAGARAEIGYVVRLEPSVREGLMVNRAVAATAIGLTSNEARSAVRVTAPLMSSVLTLIGRVTEGGCTTAGRGVPGVRVLLEDGRYTVTDEDGLYHFEGVRAGVHVVQLDVARLPPGLEPLACGDTNRNAKRAFSQFVDAGGGSLWRGDFRLRRLREAAPAGPATSPKPMLTASDDAKAAGAEIDFLAGATPGTDWLFPLPDHNPRAPALRVAVKHRPDQTVRLSVAGRPVDALAFDGVQLSADRQVAVSVWRGIPLQEGSNALAADVSAGKDAPAVRLVRTVHYANTPDRATLAPERSRLLADGVNPPLIAVRFTDKAGRPVRSGTTGSFRVDAPYRAASEVEAEQQRQLAGLDSYATVWRVEGDDGVALIPLAPTTQTGSAHLTFDFPSQREVRTQSLRAWLEPGQQDWVVVGFAAGTVGHATLRDHGTPMIPSGSDATTTDGQVILFAKGRIPGNWLLTLAYDSEKKAEPGGRRSLTSVIDPGQYYTIYGDGSEQAFDASSAKKLYLRLDRKQVYALFGDFETGLTDTELSRYSRSLTGLKAERQGQVLNAAGFAALSDLRYAREEFQGTGLAGLYRLARRDIVLNSDKVRIEVRDRFRSERVLGSRGLTRHIDYDIDYDTGGLTFREPVLSRDRDLNPIFVVVEYETVGAAGETLSAGGRVSATLRDGRVVLGATAIHDDADQTQTDLAGMDARIQVAPGTEVRLEVATTRRRADAETPSRSGLAYLAEVEHRSGRLDALAYVREQQSGFGLGQQNLSEAGSRKIGGDLRYDLTEQIDVLGTAYRESFETTGGERDVVEGSLERQTPDMTLRIGARHVSDRVGGETRRSDQLVLGASRRLLDRRLELTGEKSFNLGGDAESIDFPDRTRLGAAYALRDNVRLIASHELAEGERFDAANTQLGIDVDPWSGAQLSATLNQAAIGENGGRTFAQFGMTQSLVLGERWAADLAVDSGRTLAGRIDPAIVVNPNYPRASGGSLIAPGLVEDFWAISAGGTYRSELWSWNGRAEYRSGDLAERMAISSGFLRQTRAGVAFAAGAHLSRIDDADRRYTATARADLSWAYRPLDSRWSVLNKLEYRADESHGGGPSSFAPSLLTGPSDTKLRRLINNFAVNYGAAANGTSRRDLQASLYYGSKYVFDRFDAVGYDGYTDVLGLEVRHDVTRLVDVGFNAAAQHAWKIDARAYSFGPSIGIAPFANAWLSVGYNVVGFEDRDADGSRYTRKGPYAVMRFKFDQLTPGELGRVLKRTRP